MVRFSVLSVVYNHARFTAAANGTGQGRIFKAVLYDVRLDDDFASYLYYRTQRH